MYAVLVLVLGTGAFTGLTESDIQSTTFALWACAYGVAGLGLLDDRFRRRLPLRVPPTVLAVVCLALASVVWSAAPGITLRRVLGLAGTVLVGVYLARRLPPVDLFDALRRAVLIVAIASLVLFLSGSPLALDEVHGTLRGVLSTKNTLGRVLALGVLAAAAVGLVDARRRRRALVSGVAMIGLLPLTASTGGAVMTGVVVLGTAAVAVVTHPRGRLAFVGLGALVLTGLLIYLPQTTFGSVTGAVGKDATLTGRTEIWDASVRAIAKHPTLGYGYATFWNEEQPIPEAQRIRTSLQWDVPNSHNGILEMTIDLGLVGAALALAALLSLVVRGFLDLRAGHVTVAALRLTIATVTIVSNVAETGLFQLNSAYTVLLVAGLAAPSPAATRLRPTHEPLEPLAVEHK